MWTSTDQLQIIQLVMSSFKYINGLGREVHYFQIVHTNLMEIGGIQTNEGKLRAHIQSRQKTYKRHPMKRGRINQCLW